MQWQYYYSDILSNNVKKVAKSHNETHLILKKFVFVQKMKYYYGTKIVKYG